MHGMKTVATAAIAGLLLATGPSLGASAKTRSPACVRVAGELVCKLDVTPKQKRRHAPLHRLVGKTEYQRNIKACPAGTRPDGKWYLVHCGKNKLCRRMCKRVVIRR